MKYFIMAKLKLFIIKALIKEVFIEYFINAVIKLSIIKALIKKGFMINVHIFTNKLIIIIIIINIYQVFMINLNYYSSIKVLNFIKITLNFKQHCKNYWLIDIIRDNSYIVKINLKII